jgi:hypothetical protein
MPLAIMLFFGQRAHQSPEQFERRGMIVVSIAVLVGLLIRCGVTLHFSCGTALL